MPTVRYLKNSNVWTDNTYQVTSFRQSNVTSPFTCTGQFLVTYDYIPKTIKPTNSSSNSIITHDNNRALAIGLGVGLGIGIPVLAVLVVLGIVIASMLYNKKRRSQTSFSEKGIISNKTFELIEDI